MSSTGPTDSSASGADRRRYVRQPILLDAMISIQGRKPLPCVVRDFCVAGIFVALSPEYLHDITKQTNATLHFALIIEGSQRNFQLGLTIFRLVGNGLGCGFNQPDPAVVSLLQNLADASNPEVPDSPESFKETQSGFRREYLQIKDQLIALCDERIKILVQDFIRVADEQLFISARDAGSNIEETSYLDGQSEFRKRRTVIERDVPNLMRKAVQIINSPIKKVTESSEEESGPSELSLIDKDEFEEFLTVSELVSEFEPKFQKQVFELEKRFGYLARKKLDAHSNPVGPEVICNIFADSLKNLQSDRTAINQIYSGLRNALDAGLERFYDSINLFLVQHDILPIIEKEKPGFKHESSSKRSRAPSQPERNDDTLPPQDLSVTLGGFGATSPSLNSSASRRSRRASQPAPPLAPLQPELGAPGVVQQGAGANQAFDATYGGGAQQAPGYLAPQPAGQMAPGQVSPDQSQVPAGVAPGQVTAGQVAPGQFGSTGAMNFDATFGGLVGAPAVYATPSLQQAYSTAQTQLALRRDLRQQLAGPAGTPPPVGVAYPQGQVVDGLTSVQQSLAQEENLGLLGGSSIKDRILESIKSAGGGEGHIGQAQADAIEVIANLFESLISDAYLTDGAKSNLARLQAPVHKVALMDNDFFEATNHPVRQVLNRVALVDDSADEHGVLQNERISALIEQVNQQFTDDVSIFNPVVNELDEILRDQRTRYQGNIEGVVQTSIEQQKIMQDRRSKDLSATDTSTLKKQLPPEWNKWLDRVRALAVGDRFVMNANTSKPFPVSLVWIGEDNEPFVLVDQKGHKVSTLTMQQVAMYLRRGTLKMLDPNAASAVDRALFGMVNKMHGDVEEQVTRDELTHFLNRKSFLQAIDNNLPEQKKKDQGAALSQISIDNLKDINDRDGVEAGDSLLENIASALKETLGEKAITFGRLSGAELAIYWHKGGVLSAQKKLQKCIDDFKEINGGEDDKVFELSVAAGLVSVEDKLTPAKDLLTIVGEACQTAKDTPDKTIYIVGSENKYKEKLEQMVSYIGKAIDRERLVFLVQKVRSLGEEAQLPAAHVVVSAEDRNGRIIPPALFEQALEKSERAFDVDTWLIKKSLGWIKDDEKILESYSAVIVPLSLAAVQRDDLANTVITELMETAVPPGRIAFEIADKNVVSNLTEVTDMMRTLTEFGCRFILDEFGSGQDNYDYLKELPADFVTIQSDFIREAAENQKDFAMAKSINELAHFMGKRTLAKQERGEEIQETLKELGIDFIFDRSRSSRVAETNV